MKRVLCVGSVTADVIVFPADRIPPPGTLVSVERVTTHVGGCAANASLDLARIGVPVSLSCKLGKDIYGEFVLKTLSSNGVDVSGVVSDGGVTTTVSVVCVASSGERSFLYNPGSSSEFVLDDIPESLVSRSDIVFAAGAMLLSRFDGKPCAELMRYARHIGKFTAMDTAWDFDGIWLDKIKPVLPYLDLFMPSVDEAAKLTGLSEPQAMADAFLKLGVKNVIIKLGKDGALICECGKTPFISPAFKIDRVVDTTGAGDAFCAGFLAGLACGFSYKRCADLGNASGALCVTAYGASDGLRPLNEIYEFMRKSGR